MSKEAAARELTKEIDRLTKEVASLTKMRDALLSTALIAATDSEPVSRTIQAKRPSKGTKKARKRTISPEGLERIREASKRRWAAQKKAAAKAGGTASKKVGAKEPQSAKGAKKLKKRAISPEGRRRISEASKRRWAAQKKAAASAK